MHSDRPSPDGRGMKEGALAGKRLNPSPCFSSAEEKWGREREVDPAAWPARGASPPSPDHHSEIMNENEK